MTFIDYGSVQQRVDEFDKRHGGNPVKDGEWLLYADGAYRELNPLGMLCEPSGAYDRAKRVMRYFEIRLNVAVTDFDQAKAFYRERGTSHWLDEKAVIEQLNELRRRALRMKKLYDQALAEVDRLTPHGLRPIQQPRTEPLEANRELASKLEKITI